MQSVKKKFINSTIDESNGEKVHTHMFTHVSIMVNFLVILLYSAPVILILKLIIFKVLLLTAIFYYVT